MRRAFPLLPILSMLSACSASFGALGPDEEEDLPAGVDDDPEGAADPDRTAPTIRIDSPAPGAFIDEATVPAIELRGVVEDDRPGAVTVTVGGMELPVGADGSFRQTLQAPAPGVHTFELEATDAAGNVAAAVPSVLYGTFEDGPVSPALVARLGRQALDVAADVVEGRLSGVDFEALVLDENPVAQGIWGTTTIEALRYGPFRVTLAPAQGHLNVSVRLNDVDADLHNDAPGPWNQDGWARADAAIVDAEARAWIEVGGGVHVSIENTEVTLDGFDFDVSGIEGESLVRDSLRGVVEGKLEGIVRDRVPGMLEGALSDLDPRWQLDLLGVSAEVALAFESLEVDSAGIELSASVALDVEDAGVAPPSPGSLRTEGDAPRLDGNGVSVAIADDLANAVLHAAWRAGVLHRTAALPGIGGGDGLTVGALALLLPALGDLAPAAAPVEATIDPQLPPVLALRENGEVAAALGELHVQLTALADDGPVPLLHLVARLDARVAPSFTDAGHISIKLVDWSIVAEPSDPPPGVPRGQEFGALLDSVIDLVAPSIAGSLAEVPIPSIGGLSVESPTATPGGPDGDWLTLTAGLARSE